MNIEEIDFVLPDSDLPFAQGFDKLPPTSVLVLTLRLALVGPKELLSGPGYEFSFSPVAIQVLNQGEELLCVQNLAAAPGDDQSSVIAGLEVTNNSAGLALDLAKAQDFSDMVCSTWADMNSSLSPKGTVCTASRDPLHELSEGWALDRTVATGLSSVLQYADLSRRIMDALIDDEPDALIDELTFQQMSLCKVFFDFPTSRGEFFGLRQAYRDLPMHQKPISFREFFVAHKNSAKMFKKDREGMFILAPKTQARVQEVIRFYLDGSLAPGLKTREKVMSAIERVIRPSLLHKRLLSDLAGEVVDRELAERGLGGRDSPSRVDRPRG